jgi:hypothetical protein
VADIDGFITALLGTLGAPDTDMNRRFLQNWQRWEGGWTNNRATYNPWNSTRGNFPGINSVGVRAYPDMKTGLAFTKQTMLNGRYPDIVSGLKDGNPYDNPIADDLQVWVSGRPDGNAGYARKVMGGQYKPASNKSTARTPLQAKGYPTSTPPAPPQQSGGLSPFQSALLGRLTERGRNPQMIALMANMLASSRLPDEPQNVADPGKLAEAERHLQSVKAGKGVLVTSKGWKHTPHAGGITDGLGWGDKGVPGDILARPGTKVGAPVSGVITRKSSAQGGEALYLKGDDGNEYWLGHIENALPEGTRVKTNQVIAVISDEHKNPHLHITKRKAR